ncbi:MAG: NYN domain-containing protein, partial [bacterium]|nr:NYN domain-containing protein [bacterium]
PKGEECAILLDIENLFFAACGDPMASEASSRNKLLGRIIGYVKELALGYAPRVRSYAALGFSQRHKSVSWISFVLAKADFRVMIVPAGPNAADTALRDLGLLLAVDDNVGAVVLATGDGREPFPELLEILLEAGKRVHVVSYDGAPLSMHIEGVEHTSLAPHLRILLEEETAESSQAEARVQARMHNGMTVSVPPWTARAEDSTGSSQEAAVTALGGISLVAVVPETNMVEAIRRSYREAVRAILAGTSIEGLKRPVANLADAYKIYEDELAWGSDPRFSFGRLLGVLEAARVSGRLQAESEEEVGWIAKALVNFTDAFDHLDMYIESANGRFANLLKARVTR